MRWAFLLLMAALALGQPVAAQSPADPPIVRTSLDPASGAVIGQPVLLVVEVMFPGEMEHPPVVKIGEAPGAQVMRFETQALTIRDRIAGRDYVGQRFTFTLFGRRGGTIDVPAAEVTLLDRAGEPVGSAAGAPVRFDVMVPAGIDPSGPVIASKDVRVRQEWAPDPAGSFKAGRAIKRIIHRQAADVPALGMADFAFAAPEGVRVYPDPPKEEDEINRGSVKGIRTDTVTYVFEKPGVYRLPPLVQPWWSLAANEARAETMDGASIDVAAAPSRHETSGFGARLSRSGVTGLIVAGCLLALLAVLQYARRLLALRRRRREDYLAGALHARDGLRRVSRRGDAAETYAALDNWLRRLSADERARVRSDRALGPLVTRLDANVFGNLRGWGSEDGRAFSRALAAFGRRGPRFARAPGDSLPPLNPAVPKRA